MHKSILGNLILENVYIQIFNSFSLINPKSHIKSLETYILRNIFHENAHLHNYILGLLKNIKSHQKAEEMTHLLYCSNYR